MNKFRNNIILEQIIRKINSYIILLFNLQDKVFFSFILPILIVLTIWMMMIKKGKLILITIS